MEIAVFAHASQVRCCTRHVHAIVMSRACPGIHAAAVRQAAARH
jgi:hypothetical protein